MVFPDSSMAGDQSWSMCIFCELAGSNDHLHQGLGASPHHQRHSGECHSSRTCVDPPHSAELPPRAGTSNALFPCMSVADTVVQNCISTSISISMTAVKACSAGFTAGATATAKFSAYLSQVPSCQVFQHIHPKAASFQSSVSECCFQDRRCVALQVAVFGQDTPIGRPGQPKEYGPVAVFLATEADSSYVVGAIVGVTGGGLIN